MTPPPIHLLSERERECLRLVYRRRTSKEIGRALNLAEGTVKGYCDSAKTKLGAQDRRQAAEWLAAAETSDLDPTEAGVPSGWVAPPAPPAPSIAHGGGPDWRSLLPIRQHGAQHNVLSRRARALWPFILAAAFAVGFGMFAIGADVVSRALRALG